MNPNNRVNSVAPMLATSPISGHPARSSLGRIRLGLNCIFNDPALRFRGMTAQRAAAMTAKDRMQALGRIWLHNADTLLAAVQQLDRWRIGAYVVFNPLLPLYTLPGLGLSPEELDKWPDVLHCLGVVNTFCRQHDIRLGFHPDQYVVPSSPTADTRTRSIANLAYHAMLCDYLGADVITIHLGGAYGDKRAAISRFIDAVDELPDGVRRRLAIENDDSIYTPTDIMYVSNAVGLPFTYDVHHHRINPDGMSVEAATEMSIESWSSRGMEPCFHIASSLDGSGAGSERRRHAADIDVRDIPDCWLSLTQPVTVIVESKGRETAVFKLRDDLAPQVRRTA